jgi:uncharacterized protein YkwD
VSRPAARLVLPLTLVALLAACDEGPLPAGAEASDAGRNDPPGTGGMGATGTGGRGPRGTGGTSPVTTGTGGTTGASPTTPSTDCSLTRPGATGKETDGVIPVCCRPTTSDKALIDEVFRLLNEHRTKNGRTALAYDDTLESAIQGHCRHMATHTFFAHDAPEPAVASPWERAKLCGASASGENIAYNQPTPAAVIETWIESPGHNENMLNPAFKKVGICHHQRRWAQLFAR